LAGSSRTCRARRHALGILPNGITPAEQAVTNEIVARLRDHALSRAPRTNGLSAFSTRHVPRYLHPVPPFHRKLLPVIPPQGGVPALCGDYAPSSRAIVPRLFSLPCTNRTVSALNSGENDRRFLRLCFPMTPSYRTFVRVGVSTRPGQAPPEPRLTRDDGRQAAEAKFRAQLEAVVVENAQER